MFALGSVNFGSGIFGFPFLFNFLFVILLFMAAEAPSERHVFRGLGVAVAYCLANCGSAYYGGDTVMNWHWMGKAKHGIARQGKGTTWLGFFL